MRADNSVQPDYRESQLPSAPQLSSPTSFKDSSAPKLWLLKGFAVPMSGHCMKRDGTCTVNRTLDDLHFLHGLGGANACDGLGKELLHRRRGRVATVANCLGELVEVLLRFFVG